MFRQLASARAHGLEPPDKFKFSVFGKGTPLNPKNELLLAHLRGDEDFEEHFLKGVFGSFYSKV